VQFDGRLVGTKRRPVEQAQAEIDWWSSPAHRRSHRAPAAKIPEHTAFVRGRSAAGPGRNRCANRAGSTHRPASIARAATSVPCGKAWLDWPPCRPRYRAATRAR
jgi:hypothetical protein